ISATSPATIGDSTAGSSTLPTMPANLTASGPAATNVAPIRPPMRACDELEGSPSSHVSRFHKIAPTSPAKITAGVILVSSTNPLEIVLATWTDKNAPTRLRTPASRTAVRGRSAPVAIVVATALAVSWNPLVKSKASAVRTTTTRTTSAMSISPSLGAGDGRTVRTREQQVNRPEDGERVTRTSSDPAAVGSQSSLWAGGTRGWIVSILWNSW